jgi:hypothetical protein
VQASCESIFQRRQLLFNLAGDSSHCGVHNLRHARGGCRTGLFPGLSLGTSSNHPLQDYLRAWGITAAIGFISRPCRRRSTPKGSSVHWETVHPASGLPQPHQATNTIKSLPPAVSPEKDSDTGRIFEQSGALSEKDTQTFEKLYSNLVRAC